MAKATYLLGQDSTTDVIVSAFTEVVWSSVTVEVTGGRQHGGIDDVTGSNDTTVKFKTKTPEWKIQTAGWLFDTGANVYAKSNAITLAFQNLNLRAMEWSLTRMWSLEDVTGSGDTTTHRTYVSGMPVTVLSAKCVALASGPDLHLDTTDAGSVTATMDLFGTLTSAGNAAGHPVVRTRKLQTQYRGGKVGVEVEIIFSGALTYAVASTNPADMSAFFGAVTTAPRNDLSIKFSGGDAFTSPTGDALGKAIVERVTVMGTRRSGGGMRVIMAHRFDGD